METAVCISAPPMCFTAPYLYFHPLNSTMRKIVLASLALVAGVSAIHATDRITHNPDATNEGSILHVWSWNFPTIADKMKRIAEAGYTMLQTSPVQFASYCRRWWGNSNSRHVVSTLRWSRRDYV